MDDADRFARAPDGLRIHYRDLGPRDAAIPPLLCLPGLTRTVDDFAVLADRIAAGSDGEAPRRVIAVEYRGRGESDRDPDPARYSVPVEADDVLAVLADAGVDAAVVLGTSRGGLIAFVLAARHPALFRGLILNDIGPVLEPAGLARIRGYVGQMPTIETWDDAVAAARRSTGSDFTALDEAGWRALAALTFTDRGGRFALRYDAALAQSLKDLDLAALPDLWDRYPALFHVPLLVVRGANSDLLSDATAEEMVRRHPDAALHLVPAQGHAPLLTDDATIARIAAFARHCDMARPATPAAS